MSMTHYESLNSPMDDGEYIYREYKVCIQHCEYVDEDGHICNVYLGVEYPRLYCREHDTKKF